MEEIRITQEQMDKVVAYINSKKFERGWKKIQKALVKWEKKQKEDRIISFEKLHEPMTI
ncbi:MAG TPA: hypothetical protein PKN48_00130 [Bacteroidales bacterium]|nr:hypothetical protein [Bacteroidales bacterium]